MKKLLLMSALLLIAISVVVLHRPFAQTQYIPRAVFCPTLSNAPCSQLPAYIGPDPALGKGIRGYSGLFGPFPTSAANDVQTPFDNMAWQMFIALNWAASQVKQPGQRPDDAGTTRMGSRRGWGQVFTIDIG